MTKLSLFLTSLVAALPGALLAYLTVMSFIDYGEGSSGVMKGLAGLGAAMGSLLALMPVGILVLVRSPGSEKKAKPEEKPAEAAASAAVADDEVGGEDLEVSGVSMELETAEGVEGESMELETAEADLGESMELETVEEEAVVEEFGDTEAEEKPSGGTEDAMEVVDFLKDSSGEIDFADDLADDEDEGTGKKKKK